MEFWSAKQLRREFEVKASFYRLKVGSELLLCRNHAVINRKGHTSQGQPDALVIMANPGSCKPADPFYEPPIIQSNYEKLPYVLANTDPTQYQLMRLMKLMNWNEVSIINLSDLCSGELGRFSEILNLVSKHGIKYHSIFSVERVEERKKHFQKSSRIILAWGQDSSIKILAKSTLNLIANEIPVLGLRFSDRNWAYRHPLPRLKENQIKWLNDMEDQLKVNSY